MTEIVSKKKERIGSSWTGSGFGILMLLSSVIAFSQTPLFFPTIERVARYRELMSQSGH